MDYAEQKRITHEIEESLRTPPEEKKRPYVMCVTCGLEMDVEDALIYRYDEENYCDRCIERELDKLRERCEKDFESWRGKV